MLKGHIEKVKGHLPTPLDFDLSVEEWGKVGAQVVNGILSNVLNQQTSTGGRLKKNAPSTLARKFSLRRGSKSLVDDPGQRRFSRRGSFVIESDANGVTVYPRAIDISRKVQLKGYLGWMRPGVVAWEKIKKIVMASIRRNRAAAKGGRRKR